MEVEMYCIYSREEFSDRFPYMLVAETFTRSISQTGKFKKMFQERFPTEQERRKVMEMVRHSKDYAFRKGVPEEVRMRPKTALLWDRLAIFCSEVG